MSGYERLPRGVTWRSQPCLGFAIPVGELMRWLGEPLERDLDSNGVGLFDLWTVRFPCGLEVALWSFHMSNSMEVPAEEPRGVEVYANDTDGAHVLAHLPFRIPAASIWLPERSPPTELLWIVMRQDESGTRFPIKQCSTRCEAELVVREFELRGHKQHYWFEPVSASRVG